MIHPKFKVIQWMTYVYIIFLNYLLKCWLRYKTEEKNCSLPLLSSQSGGVMGEGDVYELMLYQHLKDLLFKVLWAKGVTIIIRQKWCGKDDALCIHVQHMCKADDALEDDASKPRFLCFLRTDLDLMS